MHSEENLSDLWLPGGGELDEGSWKVKTFGYKINKY